MITEETLIKNALSGRLKTPIQQRIEATVTDGRGYQSIQDQERNKMYDSLNMFSRYGEIKVDKVLDSILRYEKDMTDTPEGLRLHLARMEYRDNPTQRLAETIRAYENVISLMAESELIRFNNIIIDLFKPDEKILRNEEILKKPGKYDLELITKDRN